MTEHNILAVFWFEMILRKRVSRNNFHFDCKYLQTIDHVFTTKSICTAAIKVPIINKSKFHFNFWYWQALV